MRNFFTIVIYFLLPLSVLSLGFSALTLRRVSSKGWKNWFHDTAFLQPLGSILMAIGYICYMLIQITHTTVETWLAVLVLGFVLFQFLGAFFIFRVYWIRPKKENK